MLMTYASAGVLAVTAVVVGFAGDHQPTVVPSASPQQSAVADVCDHKSRDWSAMRAVLLAVSRFRGKSDAGVQKIAREALAGSDKFSIGEFELRFARGASGSSAPNDAVCFPKKVTFSAIRNDGDDAAFQCDATMNVKGAVLSISCKLVAG